MVLVRAAAPLFRQGLIQIRVYSGTTKTKKFRLPTNAKNRLTPATIHLGPESLILKVKRAVVHIFYL